MGKFSVLDGLRFGRVQTLTQWAREFGIDPSNIHHRMHRQGWSVARAISEPVRNGTYYQWGAGAHPERSP